MTTALVVAGVLVLLTGIPVFLPRRDRTADPEDPGVAFVVAMRGVVVGLLIVVGGIIYLGKLSGDDALVSDNVRDARRYATIGIVLGGVITVLSAGWLLTERIRPTTRQRLGRGTHPMPAMRRADPRCSA
jgi:hypothetical protein